MSKQKHFCSLCHQEGHSISSHREGNKKRCTICNELGHNKARHTSVRLLYPAVPGRKRCSICHNLGHTKGFHDPSRETKIPKRLAPDRKYHCSICEQCGHRRNPHSEQTGKPKTYRCYRCGQYFPREQFRYAEHLDIQGNTFGRQGRICSECLDIKSCSILTRVTTEVEKIIYARLRTTIERSSHQNRQCDIDFPFLLELYKRQDGKCLYSGLPMDAASGSMGISIDRCDSNLGYTKDNVVLVCAVVNEMKNDTPESDFIEMCRRIAENSASSMGTRNL